MYTSYVDNEYYKEVYQGIVISDEKLQKLLKQASRHIDSLTFNQIIGIGFDNLTEFQKDIVREIICLQADFEHENEDMINSILSSYSINGVSMSIDKSWNIHIENGIIMNKSTFTMLAQTGLTCRVMR